MISILHIQTQFLYALIYLIWFKKSIYLNQNQDTLNYSIKIILFFILTHVSFTSIAQSTLLKNSLIRADIHYGFVLPEYKNFNYLINKPVTGFELSFIKKTTGKNSWENIYKYPEYGVTYSFTTLGNKDVFGYEMGLFPFVQTYLIRKKRFQLTHQFGIGVGYVTKKFDINSNYENISIGSHFNIHFNFKLGTKIQLTDKISFNSGLSFSHFSNANMAEPNLGINLFTAYTGLNYALGEQSELKKLEIEKHEPKHEFAFIYAAGGKHTRALQLTAYFTSSFSAEYKFQWKRKFHFGGGLDLFYDSSTKVEMSSPTSEAYQSIYDLRSGIHFSQEIVYNRFSFILQEGYYVGLTDHVNHKGMYNRGILRWKFDRYLVSVSMKSHLYILDYPEIGFGYYFTRKR